MISPQKISTLSTEGGKLPTYLELYKEDFLSDEAFDQCFSPQFKKDKDEPDYVERVTVQIFAHLHSFADRVNRSEIEAAMAPVQPPQNKIEVLKPVVTYRARPLSKEPTIYQAENPDLPIHTHHVLHNIWKSLAYILSGYESYHSSQDSRTTEKMLEDLKTHNIAWLGLTGFYHPYFNSRMTRAFGRADKLLKKRQAYAQDTYSQRLKFYASLALALVGKLLDQRVFTVLGLAASAITLIFMCTHYGRNSIMLGKLEDELKDSLKNIEDDARKNRIIQ